jgi:pilus assembly protein CpaB
MRQYLNQERRKLQHEWQRLMADYQQPLEVVVAAKDLPEGLPLEPSHLKMATVPEKFMQPYAVKSPQELVGRVTIAPMAEGEQVLLTKVRSADEVPADAILSGLTPKGKRAVTIGVDAITGVGGFVRPGDTVDVLWTFKLPQAGQPEGQVVTLTLFQDVPVLAVGHQMVGRSMRTAEESAEYTVTLALNPQETSFLLFAREQGRIQLSLRSRLESGQTAVAPANINTLLESQLGIKAAAPVSPAVKKAEIYKGLKRDVVVFSEDGVLAAKGE